MATFNDEIKALNAQLLAELTAINSLADLEQFRIAYLGRSGKIAELMPRLKALSIEEKQQSGPAIQLLKQSVQEAFDAKKMHFEARNLEQSLAREKYFDVTLEKPHLAQGSLHPITQTYADIAAIFISMGYEIVEGPEVETEYYNFEALNIPEGHPARDMWDTLWLDIPGMLLRTHTSSVQIHSMKEKQLPLAIVAPGRVYRHEATDATHDFMFNQAEGLVIDKNISMADLLGTVEQFFRAFFKKDDLKIRVRPSYFPFVEPGVEIDISCPFCSDGCAICKRTQWIELGGAGLVHPHVLRSCGIDPEIYSGFAFGFGIDRLTMLKYGINDIRLFAGGNLSFLEQF